MAAFPSPNFKLKNGVKSEKYIPLCDVYSATSPRVAATGSKKVKAVAAQEPPQINGHDQLKCRPIAAAKPRLTQVYSRKRKRVEKKPAFIDSLILPVKLEEVEGGDGEGGGVLVSGVKRRRSNCMELIKLGVDCSDLNKLCSQPRLRDGFRKINCTDNRNLHRIVNNVQKNDSFGNNVKKSGAVHTKKWVRLSFEGADPNKFIGLQCKVYWPLDASWYTGHVVGYNSDTGRHHVKYQDGEEEDVILANEQIKFHVSLLEMQNLKLKCCDKSLEADVIDVDEMVVLAANFDDYEEIEPGDIIWAKLTGHAVWPAIVVDESHVAEHKGLHKISGEKSVLVQFFGTYDFARVTRKQVISFLKGLLSSYHLKCKKPTFVQALEEAKLHLSEQKLPKRMLQLQNGVKSDNNNSEVHEAGVDLGDEECISHDKEMSNSRPSLKSSQMASKRTKGFPAGYRPVNVEWRDLDKCNVCHMDEEYENNLFLQCDKCRMMVHARCYGELEPTDGVLWLCNLCRPGAPESPACCLCPVTGGAMKPTTDGRWAHLACAIWIPETCLSDVKKMEPVDGLKRVNKDRWRLLCSICGVLYGACIQCSNYTCRVAYHPLCARAAGYCLEPEDVDKLHLVPSDEDEEDQCIRLLSFCKKHRPSSNERLSADERIGEKACENADHPPPSNPSGCARTEPYDFLRRRGKNTVAAVCSKRLYVENKPYLVGGCSPHMPLWNNMASDTLGRSKYSIEIQKLPTSQFDTSGKIISMTDKYNFMRVTLRKRLAFGKSAIHGFGVFTKLPHRAGDMVIEYTGELIRPSVADRREHMIYNSLVGAGTYMFRIDDERVIDATRAGSIAHLINHSCEPNCYSRVISMNGDDHIIIFAKRDIKQWEELTYDYRFFSIDERLACYCGSSRCRGVVNDTEAEERVSKIYAPRSELKDWQGE